MAKFANLCGVLIFCYPICISEINILYTVTEPIDLYSVALEQEPNIVIFQPLLILLLSYLLLCQLGLRWLWFFSYLIATRTDYKS